MFSFILFINQAVMQQVFGTMNTFLQQDESTRQRHLRIRTYKVVPLSRRSGLLEWLVLLFLFLFFFFF